MDRQTLIIATALALFSAFLLGWFANWLIHRLTRATPAEVAAMGGMADRLHRVESDRDAARQQAAQAERDRDSARAELAEAQVEIEELRDYIDRKLAER